MTIDDTERSGLDLAGVGMPQFGLFPIYTESGVERFISVVAIVYEIEVAIRQLAMDKEHIRIGFRLRVAEVWADMNVGKRVCQFLIAVHFALANRMAAARGP